MPPLCRETIISQTTHESERWDKIDKHVKLPGNIEYNEINIIRLYSGEKIIKITISVLYNMWFDITFRVI